jgi:hypothetical protein
MPSTVNTGYMIIGLNCIYEKNRPSCFSRLKNKELNKITVRAWHLLGMLIFLVGVAIGFAIIVIFLVSNKVMTF